MKESQELSPVAATSDERVSAELERLEQIERFKATLAQKYDGVSDRQLLELAAHNSEMTRADVMKIRDLVGPAMLKLQEGGLMGMLGVGRKGK